MDKMKKEIKKFNVEELRQRRERPITIKVNGKVYDTFQMIMKEQKLSPSAILNQFMNLVNDLLQEEKGGEIAFIFEPIKKEEDRITEVKLIKGKEEYHKVKAEVLSEEAAKKYMGKNKK